MGLRSLAVASLGLVCVASAASASNYVGLSLFGAETDDSRLVEDGVGFRLNYGWGNAEHLQLELQFAQVGLETGAGGGTDFYQSKLGFDASWRFLENTQWQPYLLVGLGAVYDDVTPDNLDDTNVFANAGLGLLTPPISKNKTRLRFDARYVHSEFLDGMQDIHYGLGVEIPLWQERVVERVVEKVIYRDVPVVQAAALDSDFDGVADTYDRCPSTLRGASVDSSGCVVQQQVIVLEGVQFASDSSRILPSSTRQLDAVAAAMLSQQSLRVEIAGHTDASGGFLHNLALSERRANAVREQLMRRGIDGGRLNAQGYGEGAPVTENDTVEGRAQNRRVEFRVLGQ